MSGVVGEIPGKAPAEVDGFGDRANAVAILGKCRERHSLGFKLCGEKRPVPGVIDRQAKEIRRRKVSKAEKIRIVLTGLRGASS